MNCKYKYKATDGNGGGWEGITKDKYGSMLEAVKYLQKTTHSLIWVKVHYD